MELNIENVVKNMNGFFAAGHTRTLAFRIEQLKKLRTMIRTHEEEILEALRADLRKPDFEAIFSETQIVLQEIDHVITHLRQWMEPLTVDTPLMHFPAESHIVHEPYGTCLIIAPWNYPFQLLVAPLIGAMAAGNCCVLKPSEISVNTARLVSKLFAANFQPDYIRVVEGGVEETTALLRQKFDYIFYTGSTQVGKIVMEAAARHLTPVTLELGGKSPCIADKKIKIPVAARSICWGKFFNAGQTCIAPDYLLVHKDIRDELLEEMGKAIVRFYGKDAAKSPDYARIIGERHFRRLVSLIDREKVFHGGSYDESQLYIEPTILTHVEWDDKVMADEIFGPLLPVLEFSDPEEAVAMINARPKPLAMYIFSRSDRFADYLTSRTSSGGVCINDTLSHITTHSLPFGGVGDSGMGAYHGKASYTLFSHAKPVMRKSMGIEMKLRYPPYRKVTPWLRKIISMIS